MHTHLRAITTRVVLCVGAAGLLAGCQGTPMSGHDADQPLPEPVQDLLTAHGEDAWEALSTIEYATEVDFAGIPYRSQTRLAIDEWSIEERVSEPVAFTMRQVDGLVEVSEGDAPSGFNVDAMINRWPYFFAAPFVIGRDAAALTYLGPVLVDGRIYDAVRVDPDVGDSVCPVDWLVAYITSPGNEVGIGHLAMLRYPVTFPAQGGEMVTAEHVAVYEPLAAYETVAGEIVVPETITFHAWIGDFSTDGPEGTMNADETLGTVTFHVLDAE